MPKTNKAYILGAGPAGLVTAWKLLENNWQVEIFEKGKIVGGMCRTWKWNDFLVDTGPHIYHTPDKLLSDFWENEFGDLLIKGDFWCKNVKGVSYNEYWDYPLSWESISKYPTNLKKKILSEISNCSLEKRARARNFKEYMIAQLGITLTNMFFRDYPKKIWGINTEDMIADWAPKRIEIRQNVTPFYHGQFSAVGKYGTGCVYERIKDKILKLGGKLYLNSTVNGFDTEGAKIKRIRFLNNKSHNVGGNEVVISTLPITLTGKLLGFSSKLKFRGIKSVYLAYKKNSILPKGIHWMYYDSSEVIFNRITETKKLSKYIAPEDKTFLTAEITFAKGDYIDSIDNNELMKLVGKQIETVGLSKFSGIVDMSNNSEYFVYPIQYLGYNEELSIIQSKINQYEQLYSIGTGGDFSYADSQVLFHKAFDTAEILCGKDSISTQVIRQTEAIKMNKVVNIGQNSIGDEYPAFIIAEIGLNHNGSVKIAKDLIDAAKKQGCNAVKIQTYEKDSRVSTKVKSANYAEKIIGLEESIPEMFNRLILTREQHKEIFDHARLKKIQIFSTPFDLKSVEFLESSNVKLYKIASMDLVNLPLIRKVAKTGKPMILSCGMSTLGQVEEAVNVVRTEGNRNLMLLHCNSSYPAAPEEMNLSVIQTLKKNFNIPVGLSDHTFGLSVSKIAITLGANLIERHFTIDRSMEGPDHILSSEPSEMGELVEAVKQIPKIIGDGVKRIQPNEYITLNTQRKSLYAACPIKEGEIISQSKVVIKGPGGGLLPKYLDVIIGREAKNNIDEDSPINWTDI